MSYNLSKLEEVIAYKWREQSTSAAGANMVAYVDARDVSEAFDRAVGKLNWQKETFHIEVSREVKKNPDDWKSKEVVRFESKEMFCKIGIWNPDSGQWIWKDDVGTESNTEAEKGQSSDAFKRAAVHWGVGSFLYRLGTLKLPTAPYVNGKGKETFMVATKKGDKNSILWDKSEVNRFAHLVYQFGLNEGTTRFKKGEKPNFGYVEEHHVGAGEAPTQTTTQNQAQPQQQSNKTTADTQVTQTAKAPAVDLAALLEKANGVFGVAETNRVKAAVADEAQLAYILTKCLQAADAVSVICDADENLGPQIESLLEEHLSLSSITSEMGMLSSKNPFMSKSIPENESFLSKLSKIVGK